MIVQGNIVDILNKRIFKGEVDVEGGKIKEIREANHSIENYIIPGFVDAHIHIESSMLVPSEFAKIAVTHGTIATVSDPHEIANVLDLDYSIVTSESNVDKSTLRIDIDSGVAIWGSKTNLYIEINRFIKNSEAEIRSLKDTIQSQDWLLLEQLSHKFKGIVGNLSLNQFMGLFNSLEESSKQNDVSLCENDFEKIQIFEQRKILSMIATMLVICLCAAVYIIPKTEREMRLPVIIYSVVIITMCILAVLTGNIIIILAALAFATSDYFVGMDRFINPKNYWALAITPLYFGAQALFALSTVI